MIVPTGTRNNIARLNTDGTTDQSFFADIDLTVRAIAVQKDGKILIGGDFTSINGVPRKYLARLNPNGSRDTSFLDEIAGPRWQVKSRRAPKVTVTRW